MSVRIVPASEAHEARDDARTDFLRKLADFEAAAHLRADAAEAEAVRVAAATDRARAEAARWWGDAS